MAVTFWPGSSSARLFNRCLTVREMSKYRIVGSRLTNPGEKKVSKCMRACDEEEGRMSEEALTIKFASLYLIHPKPNPKPDRLIFSLNEDAISIDS